MFAITCEPLWRASVLSTIASGLESTFRHSAHPPPIVLSRPPLSPASKSTSYLRRNVADPAFKRCPSLRTTVSFDPVPHRCVIHHITTK